MRISRRNYTSSRVSWALMVTTVKPSSVTYVSQTYFCFPIYLSSTAFSRPEDETWWHERHVRTVFRQNAPPPRRRRPPPDFFRKTLTVVVEKILYLLLLPTAPVIQSWRELLTVGKEFTSLALNSRTFVLFQTFMCDFFDVFSMQWTKLRKLGSLL